MVSLPNIEVSCNVSLNQSNELSMNAFKVGAPRYNLVCNLAIDPIFGEFGEGLLLALPFPHQIRNLANHQPHLLQETTLSSKFIHAVQGPSVVFLFFFMSSTNVFCRSSK